VLSVYFLGLALGNHLAGRVAHRLARPMRLYFGVELLIGVWGVLFGVLLGGLNPLYAALYRSLAPGSPWIHVLRLTSAALVLLVPSTCMGATLPLLAQAGARELSAASRWSGLLYGMNTLGAMAGAALTGFVLIDRMGVSLPLALTAVLNLACALCVLPWMSGEAKAVASPPAQAAHAPRPVGAGAGDGRFRQRILLSFGALGFANLAIEVLWTHFYALIFPNDTYIFSAILIVYLFGVGAGSVAARALLHRMRRPVLALGILQLLSAAASLLMILFVPALVRLMTPHTHNFGDQLGHYFVAVAAGTLAPTLCMGATFPLLVRVVLSDPLQTGEVVGRALAWNTIGGVLGAAIGGFVLLNLGGIELGLFAVIVLTGLIGIGVCALERNERQPGWVPALAVGTLAILALTAFRVRLPDDLLKLQFPEGAGYKILETRPSVHGTVAITDENSGTRRVWINSDWVAQSRSHLFLGYIPWLLHPGPVRSALGICCGSGRTFGALLNAGIPDLDLVDINPAVIHLSRKWLKEYNHAVLSDPRPHLLIDDGRNFVRYASKQYDLITLEPLQMYQKGVAYFYTSEFYREARARLREGGIICQWVPIYLLSEDQFRSVVRTFLDVFPNSLLWGEGGDTILLGYNAPGERPVLSAEEIYERAARPAIRQDLAQEDLSRRYDPLVYTLVDGPRLREIARGGDVYTDDRPKLEFASPWAMYTPDANLELVMRHLAPLPEIYPLPDPTLAARLEEFRQLSLASLATADPRPIQKEIEAVRFQLYGSPR
jgi:spermidine synthase